MKKNSCISYTTLFKIRRYQRPYKAGKRTWYRPILKDWWVWWRIYIWIWILPEDVISFKFYGTNIIRIFTYLLQPSMKSDFYTDHVWEGYLRKIPVERRKISRAKWRGKFSLKTGIFRKYPSRTWYICLITPNII